MMNLSVGASESATDVVVSAAGTGPATWAMGMLFERLAGAEETAGLLGASVVTQPPGQASPLLDIYDEIGIPAAERRLPDAGVSNADAARWLELAPRYGLRVVGPPIPEAEA
jgi:hypothetical protein